MEGEDPIRQYLADLRTQRKRHLLDFNGRDYLVDKFTDNGAAYYKCRECKRGRVTSLPDGSVEETKPCNDSCIPLSLEQRLCEVAKEKACRICAERTTFIQMRMIWIDKLRSSWELNVLFISQSSFKQYFVYLGTEIVKSKMFQYCRQTLLR